jgi:gliding motility-associated-like protein
MKIFYHALFCFFSILSYPLFAQCPPAGFPDSGNTCPEAPVLCENLDGYCNTINNNNIPQPFPGCAGQWTLNNDEWFAFFAGTTSITIQVTPSNCSPGQNMGLQGGIYAQCVSQPMDLQCPCTTNPFILQSNNFVVGQIYWFVIDGCGGNVCDYSIDVLEGSTVGAPPADPGPITGLTTVCQSSTTGYSITPPNAATIYNWTLNPSNAGTISGSGNSINVNWSNNATSAELCVTVANGCYVNPTPSCITVDIVPRPTAIISGSDIICQGNPSATLTVTFTGEAPWTFTPLLNGVPQAPITTSDNPYTYTVTQAGTYTLQSVSSPGGANGCTGTVSGSATVTQITITPSSTVTNEQCGTGNGAINLSVSGGNTPYTFNWSNGATTEDLSNLNAGTYTVTVTDNNGCTGVHTATVNNNNVNLNITGAVTANTTCNGGNGAIDVSINPPPGNYTYNWSNGATTQDISNLEPGSYTITVTSGVTCTATATFTVNNNPNTPNVTGTTTQSTCELSNGSINLNVSGGVSPYTFNWSNGSTTEDLSNIPAGSYSVTVTGANACTSTATFTVGNNNPPITVTGTTVANTNCNGNGNGSININVSPANPNYTFNWSNGVTTEDINNLLPGSYTVTVSAGGACTQTATFTVGNNPLNPNINFTTVQSTCELSNGSINVSVSGGVAPYTFNWSNGATTEDLSNIPAGSYSVTVTGANGCTSAASMTVTNNNPPITVTGTVVSNTTCNGNGNGSITLNVSPANPNYTFNWSNGATTQNLTNLLPGSYSVTVSAGGACTQTATFNVGDNPNVPNINLTATNTTCDQSNGSISLSVSGGVAPYTYSWSNGATTQNLANIPAGFYTVTVTGANGCSNSAGINVVNNNPVINVNATIIPNTLCNGNGNGSISLSVTPAGSYTFLWSTGATTSSINNLVQGTYTVTVTGSGSCSTVASFTIPDNPNGPNITGVTTGTSCDLSNGNINISVSGATSPYTYIWSNGATTQDISNIPAGTYTVTVSGANGCTNIANFTIDNNNPPITVTGVVAPNTFCVNGNGNINITVSSTVGPYTYIWSNGATTQDISNLPGGTYTVTVNGQGSCYEVATFDVPDEPNLPNLILDYTPSTCGQSNGDIDLMVSGGTTPYTYLWSSGQTTQDLNNVPPDLYFVTVTAANGCTAVEGGDLPDDIIPITITGVVLPDNSCSANNGRITLTVNPPPPGISILWSTGNTGLVLNNLAAGTYSVTVSAGGTCTNSATFVVPDESQPPNVSNAVTPAICGVSNGAIDLTVTGGLPPITYAWSNSANTQDLVNLPPGNYTVTVSTAGNCSAVSAISVPSNDVVISISGTITDNTSCVAPNGAVSVAVTPSGNPYTYAWSNNANTPNISNLAPGNYSVTVTTGVTCTTTASFDVANNAIAPNLAATATPATCSLNNGAADANASSGIAPYTFLWSNMATTEQISNLAQGNYSVTVTGANGCSSNASVNVANNDIALNISGLISENTSCTSGNGAINMSVSPAGSYTYIWSNNATSEDIANLDGGNYSVTVSAGGSCTAASIFIVPNNTQNPAISPVVTPAICSQNNGAIDLTISGATAPYLFEWSNSAMTEDLTNIFPGNYSVTVTAANGCTADTTLNVANNSSTFALSGTASPLTNCAADNGAVDLNITPPGNYTIVWSNGAVTEDISNLSYGTYSVSVTDPAGGDCTATASFIVDDARTYPTATQTVTPDVCNLQNGSIDLTVNGGEMPYNFLWSNNLTIEDLQNVAAGTYAVVVTSANGCTTATSATVPGNSISFSLAGTTLPNTVCGTNNGSVDLTVTPAGVYTFAWSNNAATEDLNAIPGGNYSVTVSAGGTCTNVASFTVDDNTLSPAIAEIVTPAFCAKSNGGIDLSVNGGVGPYNFLWSNSLTSEDLTNIPAGNYSVTVTGANGCSSVEAFDVPDNVITPGLSGVVTPNSSCVTANGGVVLDVTPPDIYTFAWSNGQTLQNLTNAASGDYEVTVSSGGNCTAVASFIVPDVTEPVLVSGVPQDVLCFGGNDGSIDLTVNGGVLPYQFNWSPVIAGNPEDPTSLSAGSYSVMVTDAAGCTGTATFSVLQPASAVLIACAATSTVSAPGFNDGSGQVDISGGTAPYSVNWSPGGSPANAPAGIFTFNNLSVGNYLVTVTDANGCPAACSFTVNLIDCNTAVGTMLDVPLTLCGDGCLTANYNALGQFLEPGDVLQFILHEGNSNQIINEIARSNQPTFCFDPSKMSYGTTYYVSAAAGNDDGSGNVVLNHFCTVVSLGTPITFREKPVANIAPPETLSCAVEEVSLVGSSDLTNSTFQWTASGGSIISNPAQATISVNAAGTYTLIVNLNGCKDTASVEVDDITNQPLAGISFNPSDVLDCVIEEIILSGSAEGTMAANTVWILNGAFYSGENPVPIDQPGQYEFIVLDTLTFCADTASIFINENQAYPPLFLNPPGLLTCTNPNVTLTGGSPVAGISFKWAVINGSDTTVVGTGTTLVVSAPGIYYFIGVDPQNSCTNFLTTTVNADQTLPVADAGQPFDIACFGETASLDGSSSVGLNLQFQWTTTDGNIVSGKNTPAPLINEPGTYLLLVTNSMSGCTDTDEVVIAPKPPAASLTVNQPPCFGDKGSIVIDNVIGAKPPLKYSLNDGATFTGNNIFTSLAAGDYSILILDANGCTATLDATVEQPDELLIIVEPKIEIQFGDSVQIVTQVSVAISEIADILWKPSTGLSCDTCLSPWAKPFVSTYYRVFVTSDKGCIADARVLLEVDKELNIYVPNIFSPDDDGHNDIFMIFADMKSVVKIKSFQIFDRWGDLVFEGYDFLPNDPAHGWDGSLRGQDMNPAVFVWYAKIELVDGREVLYEGDVTLQR